MDKKIKKIIVNSLTATRIIGTCFIPLMFTTLPAGVFVLAISLLCITDAIDGPLARHWHVSTIAGSLLDMSADKLFGFVILIALSTIYPIMRIPALLEALVTATNIINANNGNIGKSSQLGRIKTVIMWASISMLFLTGLSSEIIESLNNVNVSSLIEPIVSNCKRFIENINNNKEHVETIFKTAAITSESMVAADYISTANKKNDKNNNKLFSILKEKEKLKFIKSILLNEKYYEITKDMSFLEKLDPKPKQKEEIKKLMLKNVDK